MADHGAHAIMGEQFQQGRTVHRERHDVRALDAVVACLDAMFQVERRGVRQEAGHQHGFGLVRRQFADFHARGVFHHRRFRDENQFVRVQGDGGAAGHVFHGQVERFTRGRESQRRQ